MCAVFTGNNLISLVEVDSTNSYLSSLATAQRLLDGTVVIAEHQYAGKGQRGNGWQAQNGMNLTFSILYYPTALHINKQFLLTQAISLGVCDYLSQKCQQVKVKWPNDLYVNNKKIAGMLIENAIKGESIAQTVIGIGLNVNQQTFELPLENVTSLFLENKITYKLNDELLSLLSTIERRYLQWRNGQFAILKEQYLEVLYLNQIWHQYTLPNGNKLFGKIVGINEIGKLLIEDENLFIHSFGNKEIVF